MPERSNGTVSKTVDGKYSSVGSNPTSSAKHIGGVVIVFITGDCHADWTRFGMKEFPDQKDLTRDDFIIVCGDFGIWSKSKKEEWWLNWFEQKNFTVLFVDGNHENFDRLYSDEFEVVDFHGGKAHKIRENVYHLMRGYIFELCGKKFFAFGGASSHDIHDGILNPADYSTKEEFAAVYKDWYESGKMFRVNHVSWWEQELPNHVEMNRGLVNLKAHNMEVDYIITHCLPQCVASMLGFFTPDRLTRYFDGLLDASLKFKRWHCGHYHVNKNIDQYTILYEKIERIL